MATIEVKDADPAGAVRELLRAMLEKGLLSAVLVPQEIPSRKTVIPTLVRDPAELAAVNPFAPVFGVNAARILVRMCAGLVTHHGDGAAEPDEQSESVEEAPPEEAAEQPADDAGAEEQPDPAADEQAPAADAPADRAPIGAVLRPCELRAFVELVKLQQTSAAPFLTISVDCWGTYSVQQYAALVGDGSVTGSVTADFLKQAAAGEQPEQLRGACRVCRYPTSDCADLELQLFGEDADRQLRLQANSERGKDILAGLGLEETPENPQRQEVLAKLLAARKQAAEEDGADFLEIISSLCINCRNCRAVCPICYCKQCVFDGPVFEYPIEKYLDWSGKRGVLGMPTDKLLFHLTRMSHVATSCVACGQCEVACPSGIPLGTIYQKVSAAAQEALEYVAGRSPDEELPLATFREEELSVVED